MHGICQADYDFETVCLMGKSFLLFFIMMQAFIMAGTNLY